jgi:hypothetical protein
MRLALLAHALLPRFAVYLTVVATLLASIVRQGFIYLVYVHRLTPIESSMRLPYSPTVFTGGVGLRFDTMLAFT